MYSLYVAQGRLHYVNNTLGASVTTITSEAELPTHGPTTVRCEFTPTGRFQGEVALFLGDVAVGSASLPLTVPVTYGPPVSPWVTNGVRRSPRLIIPRSPLPRARSAQWWSKLKVEPGVTRRPRNARQWPSSELDSDGSRRDHDRDADLNVTR